ncbi:alpha/beta fold hydrolase, partial [Clostridia bacterium OttesenSCG-928-F22]|nr:alpha/beta fold hydrolase [Clostridia bacterium OttesenSCG-928-F22]
MSTLQANGITISYKTLGDSANPPLVMVHGLGASKDQYLIFAQHFEEEYFVIVYDARGHGESSKPDTITMKDHGRDLIALLDALNIEKANIL